MKLAPLLADPLYLPMIEDEVVKLRKLLDTIRERDTLVLELHARCASPLIAGGMDYIVLLVACHYKIDPSEVMDLSPRYRNSHPRQHAIWLMRQNRTAHGRCRWSYPVIAAYFGFADHTTALHADQAYEERLMKARTAATA